MLAQVYLANQLPEALKQWHGPKKGLPKEALEEVKRKHKHNKGEGGLCLSCSAAFSVLTEVLAKCLGAGPGPSSKRRQKVSAKISSSDISGEHCDLLLE